MHDTPPPPPATPPALPSGPWYVALPLGGMACVKDAAGHTLVFVARDPEVPAARQLAIACAVAATPTLLAACQDVRAEIMTMTYGGPFFGPLAACLHSLDAALAAATAAS